MSQTPHFLFYSRDPHLKIAANEAERCLREISELLGQPVKGQTEFFRHERAEDVAAYTGVYSTGFAEQSGDRLHSALPNHPHEIVHIVAFRLGQPGDFFQEGLAVALGDHGKVGGLPAERVAKAALAHCRTRGVAKIVEFFRACPDGPSQRDVAFARVFGRSLDSELTDWTATL